MIQTVNLSLPLELVREVDRVARKQKTSRSELLRESLRAYLWRVKLLDQAFVVGGKKAKQMGLTDEDRVERWLAR